VKLPIAVKLLLPLLSTFLGIWAAGTFSFFKGYLEKDLKNETENFSVLVSQDLHQKQELLRSQARWVADKSGLSQAMTSGNRTLLLQELLPVQSALQLNLIKVVSTDGTVLADLRQGEINQATLLDSKVSREASIGMELSDVVSAQGEAPSLLVGLISVKSQEKILGGVIVGTAITDNFLQQIRGNTEFHLVALEDSKVIASTLPDAKKTPWQRLQPTKTPQKLTIDKQRYFAKIIALNGNSNTNTQVVLLTSIAPLEEAEKRLWLSIGGLCLLGGTLALLAGIWVTRWLTRRIQTLTHATQALASGDLSTRIPVQSHDEVGILAQGFNYMAEQLTARDQKINLQVQEIEATLEKLKQTQAKLIQSEKMSSLGQMVAGIAHEINNPTSFICGNLDHANQYKRDIIDLLQLYQKYFPNPPQPIQEQIDTIELDFIVEDLTKIFDSMKNGCDRITDIVLSLRNFSRLDESEFKPVNIHEGIDSTLMILTTRFKQQNKRPEIKVIKEYDNLPPIACYPGELNQVFLNIISNAIDAFERQEEKGRKKGGESKEAEFFNYPNPYSLLPTPSTPQILIRTQLIDSEWIAIFITDNAFGMSEEVCKKAFDPFFTTKPVGKGTGLGLTISYQIIVEKHKGKIYCSSHPGQGTELLIKIPIVKLGSGE
jgi:two-component system, NtrC family, sensor kinase